jgi:hypothetical protein
LDNNPLQPNRESEASRKDRIKRGCVGTTGQGDSRNAHKKALLKGRPTPAGSNLDEED